MQEANANAFKLLIQGFEATTKKGKLAFYVAKSTMAASTGYKYGHFKSAWEKLIDKYESKDVPDLTAELVKYYAKTMEDNKDPEDFVLEMEIIKEKLFGLGEEVITDKRFAADILLKLPKSKRAGELGPYHSVKTELEKRLKADASKITFDVLRKAPKQLFTELAIELLKAVHGIKTDNYEGWLKAKNAKKARKKAPESIANWLQL